MRKDLEKKLIADGWRYNVHGDALDKGNYRVYTLDDIYVVKYNDVQTGLWRNNIDGNMPVDAIKKIIDVMVSV